MFYNKLFPKKVIERRKQRTNFVFWCLYTQLFGKLLDVIPIDISKNNNRCLADGESRNTEKFLDEFQEKKEKEYIQYATDSEKNRKTDMESIANEREEN